MPVKPAGEQIAHGVVLTPRRAAHHSSVALFPITQTRISVLFPKHTCYKTSAKLTTTPLNVTELKEKNFTGSISQSEPRTVRMCRGGAEMERVTSEHRMKSVRFTPKAFWDSLKMSKITVRKKE